MLPSLELRLPFLFFDCAFVHALAQVMDGFEMVRRYRQFESMLPRASAAQPERARMAIVGMSANSDLESQSIATEAGMNSFISKPFSVVNLQTILSVYAH